MKRHPSLHPLSRDHHHALVQARKLSLAAATNDPGQVQPAAEGFAAFWESDLQAHFAQEERIVLPLLARAAPDSDEIRETLNQHAEIRRLVAGLNDKLARRAALEASLLAALGESLRRHIRFEESELFPAVESLATEEELARMNEELETERSRAGQARCALAPKPQATEGSR